MSTWRDEDYDNAAEAEVINLAEENDRLKREIEATRSRQAMAEMSLAMLREDVRPLILCLKTLHAAGLSAGFSAYTAFTTKHPDLLPLHEKA